MFLIERLWIDTLENRNAYGYKPIGVVRSQEEADRISNLEHILKKEYPWPLEYAFEYAGDTVPRFKIKKIPDLTAMSLDRLREV